MQTRLAEIYDFIELKKGPMQKAIRAHFKINLHQQWGQDQYAYFKMLAALVGMRVDLLATFAFGFNTNGYGSIYQAAVDVPYFLTALQEKPWLKDGHETDLHFLELPLDDYFTTLVKEGVIDVIAAISGADMHQTIEIMFDARYPPQLPREYPALKTQLALLQEMVEDAAYELNQYLYRSLKAEYERLTGEAAVMMSLIRGNYTFLKDGTPFPL